MGLALEQGVARLVAILLILLSALTLLYRLAATQVVGSDIVQAVLLAAAGGLAHSAGGRVNGGLLVGLLLGPVPGVLLGRALCRRVPRPALRRLVPS